MRRALALRSLLGRVVHAQARGIGTLGRAAQAPPPSGRPLAALSSASSASSPLSLLSPLAAAAAAQAPASTTTIGQQQQQQQQARHNHCSCPTLKDESDGPPRVRVAYDPSDVEAFIAVADAIEDAFPSAVVDGDDGEEEREQQPQQQEAAAECGPAASPPPAAKGGPGCEFVVTLPNGAVAFRARAPPRDAAAVLAAIRAAGGEGMLGGGGE